MKALVKYLIFAPLLTTWGCNEKVSPELEGANSTTPPTELIVPEEYYFKVTNESATLLNYKLHKTGAGNASTECSIRKEDTSFTNDNYIEDDNVYDISCFLEAEELSFAAGGMSLGVYASKNTCDYVAYSPFSFYNKIPGDSSTTILKINCADGMGPELDNTTRNAIQASLPLPHNTGPITAVDCVNNYIDLNIDDTEDDNRSAFKVEEDEQLCRFNYLDGDEEQCDIGVITVHEIELTEDETEGVVVGTPTTTTIECGGQHYNCIRGPIKLIDEEKSRVAEVNETELNKDFSTKYDFPAPAEEGIQNWEYVNFRRHLASEEINFFDSTDITDNNYKNAFDTQTNFNPDILDRYSANKNLVSGTLIDDAVWDKNSYIYATPGDTTSKKLQNAKPLAAEPYLGYGAYRTSPFYTFYCLDYAREVKARIRLMVRDWDRIFTSTTDLTLISDIKSGVDARQDNSGQEVPDEEDEFNDFNDKYDWDNIIPMKVDQNNTASYILSPSPDNDLLYTDGFFNPDIFPWASTK